MLTLIHVTTPGEVAETRALLVSYAAEMEVDLCFQRFEAELDALPGDYAPPSGRLLLARIADQPAGCVALRPLADGICEMKRMYVRPAFRGQGLGRALGLAILAEARDGGYHTMRLDTLESLSAARGLYESLGFRPVAPYYHNPLPRVVYMELALGGA